MKRHTPAVHRTNPRCGSLSAWWLAHYLPTRNAQDHQYYLTKPGPSFAASGCLKRVKTLNNATTTTTVICRSFLLEIVIREVCYLIARALCKKIVYIGPLLIYLDTVHVGHHAISTTPIILLHSPTRPYGS